MRLKPSPPSFSGNTILGDAGGPPDSIPLELPTSPLITPYTPLCAPMIVRFRNSPCGYANLYRAQNIPDLTHLYTLLKGCLESTFSSCLMTRFTYIDLSSPARPHVF